MRWTKVMGAVMAAQLSVAAAAELNDGLVLLPGGTVTIGSPDSERQRQADELCRPARGHATRLPSSDGYQPEPLSG